MLRTRFEIAPFSIRIAYVKNIQISMNSCLPCPGGWDPSSGKIPTEIHSQIDQAFANVDIALKDAGGQGWSQVFRVNSYHLPLNDEALHAMVQKFKEYMPNHQPLWTCIGVSRLGFDDMRVEIEVVAHDPIEAKAN